MTQLRRLITYGLVGADLAMGSLATSVEPPRSTAGQFIDAPDGVPLCVYETGNPAGREILLIHGFSQSHAVFQLQFDSDLARDHRIVSFDLRGHGCSGKPWQESAYAGTRVWADDVARVITERRLRRPVIVGWSFGGYIALNYARHHGLDQLAALVLVGSNAGLPPAPTDPSTVARLAAQRESNRRAPPDIPVQIAYGQQFVELMTARPASEAMQRVMFATNQMLPTYARRAMHSLALDNQDLVAKLDRPLLFIVGDQDKTQSVAVLTRVAADLPEAAVQVMAGSGHAPFIDAPEDFNRRLREFVAAHP